MVLSAYAHLSLKLLPGRFKYVRFASTEALWASLRGLERAEHLFVFNTGEDHSMVFPEETSVAEFAEENTGWCLFRVIGPLPFDSAQGLLATISETVRQTGAGLCVVSTYLTDCFFVQEVDLERVVVALKSEGWRFE